MKHKVSVQYDEERLIDRACESLINRAIIETLQSDAVDRLCVVNVMITDD